MICQRCGREGKDDGVSRVVRIAGLYSYQDDRYELCPECLKIVKALLDNPNIILAVKLCENIEHGGAVTGYKRVIEEALV